MSEPVITQDVSIVLKNGHVLAFWLSSAHGDTVQEDEQAIRFTAHLEPGVTRELLIDVAEIASREIVTRVEQPVVSHQDASGAILSWPEGERA